MEDLRGPIGDREDEVRQRCADRDLLLGVEELQVVEAARCRPAAARNIQEVELSTRAEGITYRSGSGQ